MIYHNRATRREYDETEDKYDLNGYDAEVKRTVKALRPHADRFDFIAVRGVSGIIMGAPISLLLKKELVVVRKDEDCHQYTGNVVNAIVIPGKRGLFVDDCEASGETRMATEEAVTDRGGDTVGKYLYDGSMEAPKFYGDPDPYEREFDEA